MTERLSVSQLCLCCMELVGQSRVKPRYEYEHECNSYNNLRSQMFNIHIKTSKECLNSVDLFIWEETVQDSGDTVRITYSIQV
jgi:hypothetical protein